jgi:hypothetical protein
MTKKKARRIIDRYVKRRVAWLKAKEQGHLVEFGHAVTDSCPDGRVSVAFRWA